MDKAKLIKAVEKRLHIPKEKPKYKKLFMFFGIPGSGKTRVAKEIEKLYPSVYISSDEIALSQNLDKTEYYHWTFEIMNYLIDKYLSKGHSVIADSNSDKYEIRRELYEIADKNGAIPYCFWVKTDLQIVERRQQERKRKLHKLREENLFYISTDELKKYLNDIEVPKSTEKVYVIDGNKDIQQQLKKIERRIIDEEDENYKEIFNER